jgi:hypothetical protein
MPLKGAAPRELYNMPSKGIAWKELFKIPRKSFEGATPKELRENL